jgi:hypothetical protein
MPLLRYRGPKIAPRGALGYMNDRDLENQSRDRGRSSRRRSTTAVTGIGISEALPLNMSCNVRTIATTIWEWICRSDLTRSADWRSMRRRILNKYTALIGSTSLKRLRASSSIPLLRCWFRFCEPCYWSVVNFDQPLQLEVPGGYLTASGCGDRIERLLPFSTAPNGPIRPVLRCPWCGLD